MTLTTGTRLGAYEILSPIGAGGMGEFYCARGDEIGRDVGPYGRTAWGRGSRVESGVD